MSVLHAQRSVRSLIVRNARRLVGSRPTNHQSKFEKRRPTTRRKENPKQQEQKQIHGRLASIAEATFATVAIDFTGRQ